MGRWLNSGGGGGKVERHKKAPLARLLTSTRLLLPAGDSELYCEDTHWSLAVRWLFGWWSSASPSPVPRGSVKDFRSSSSP